MYSTLHYWSRINGLNGNLPQTLLLLWEECISREYHLLLIKTLKGKVTFESSAFHEKKSLKIYKKNSENTLDHSLTFYYTAWITVWSLHCFPQRPRLREPGSKEDLGSFHFRLFHLWTVTETKIWTIYIWQKLSMERSPSCFSSHSIISLHNYCFHSLF